MTLLQVWLSPALEMLIRGVKKRIELDTTPSIILRDVNVKVNGKLIPMLLIETNCESNDNIKELNRLGKLINRLSFGMLIDFKVVSARFIDGHETPGGMCNITSFAGCPPGISMNEIGLGFKFQGILDERLLCCEISNQAELAISWFKAGLNSSNPIQQIIYFWIGLEAIAPQKQLPMKCPKCKKTFDTCPTCNESTFGHAVNKTVSSFLIEELNVSKREADDLYKIRCKISHGNKGMDAKTIDELSGITNRLQELLLRGIKRSMNWPENQPPFTGIDGIKFIGVPGIHMTTTLDTIEFLDQPSTLPHIDL